MSGFARSRKGIFTKGVQIGELNVGLLEPLGGLARQSVARAPSRVERSGQGQVRLRDAAEHESKASRP